MSASLRTLLRRMYLYRGGRKARSARRRLIAISRRDPWAWSAILVNGFQVYSHIAAVWVAERQSVAEEPK